jgi:hypothetical protein
MRYGSYRPSVTIIHQTCVTYLQVAGITIPLTLYGGPVHPQTSNLLIFALTAHHRTIHKYRRKQREVQLSLSPETPVSDTLSTQYKDNQCVCVTAIGIIKCKSRYDLISQFTHSVQSSEYTSCRGLTAYSN